MNKPLQVITFGETMALFMPSHTEGLERAQFLSQGFGGAESNVAIGLSRLGINVGWFSRLGQDPFAQHIYKTIRGEGVDVSHVIFDEAAPTGMMFREKVMGKVAVHFRRKHSAASQMTPADLDEEYIKQADILHITGIMPALSKGCREAVFAAVKIAKEAGVKICFDPNLRLKLWTLEEARPVIFELAAQADYFLPGYDELKLLYNTEDEQSIFNELKKLKATCIVKGVGDFNVILEQGSKTQVPFYKAEHVIDTVGAGDAFCAGFLAGVVKGLSYEEAVKIAGINGALAVQTVGDWEALSTWEQVEAKLQHKTWIER